MIRGKTICFIDNANILRGQREAEWRIDWERFSGYLGKDEPIWQTYFFASEFDPDEPEAEGFYNFLREKLRWEVALYRLGRRTVRCDKCGHAETVPVEKGVDVGLAAKMLMLGINRAYDTAVLVSGDRDYVEPVTFVKGLGLRVEVISWRSSLSGELGDESSAPVLFLDDLKGEVARR